MLAERAQAAPVARGPTLVETLNAGGPPDVASP